MYLKNRVGRDHHFFGNAMATPPILCPLGRWFWIWYRKFRIKKNWSHGPFENLKLQWGPKNQNFYNLSKEKSCRLQMTKGFQIWAQNLNRSTFAPLLPKRRSETGRCQFLTVLFLPERGQVLFDVNFETKFESSSSFAAYMTPFRQRSEISFFLVPVIISKFLIAPAVNFFLEFEIFHVGLGISIPEDIKIGHVAIVLPKKWWSQPALLDNQ